MKAYGIYIGIVVQNNDPEKSGRVKVFVPSINHVANESWNRGDSDKSISSTSSDISIILDELQSALPWAINASTVGLGGSFGKLMNNSSQSDISLDNAAYITSPPIDSFGNTYTPSDYSGKEGGHYAIPNVRSNVFVFFVGGDIQKPAFFSSLHGQDEWTGVMGDHYPTKNELDGSELYKNKYSFLTNKHCLEFIDSDNEEEIILSHSKGSNLRITNNGSYEFIDGNKSILITSDNNVTIRGVCNISVTGAVNLSADGVNIVSASNVAVSGGASVTVTGGDVLADSISLKNHTHPQNNGNDNGGDTITSPPN